MKRSTLTTVLAFVLGISTATQASACCLCIPYIPMLDPLAWLGFYGCGGGYGGCAQGGYGAGYAGGYAGGYQYAPRVQSYGYGGFAPQPMAYPMAPQGAPGCSNCTGALPVPQQQAMTAVRVPVTTYRAVTQYVPQTTYQTQYRAAPAASVAYQPQVSPYQQAYGYQPAQTAYATPIYGGVASPTTAYNNAISAPVYGATATATPNYGTPYYSAPTFQPPVISSPVGDIAGDHEWSSQSAQIPVIPNSHTGGVPVRQATYGVTPRAARTFTATVK